MNLETILAQHLATCDELHRLALAENRHLAREGRPPDDDARAHRAAVSARLQASLETLRSYRLAPGERGGEALEQARARSLQILHLERENEQLLLRCSLGTTPSVPAPRPSPAAAGRAYRAT